MALIKCPECEKQISDQANSCPHCGYPIGSKVVEWNIDSLENKGKEKREFLESLVENTQESKHNPKKNEIKNKSLRRKNGCLTLVFIGAVALFILLLITLSDYKPKIKAISEPNKSENSKNDTAELSNLKLKYAKVPLNVRKSPDPKSEVIRVLKQNEGVNTMNEVRNGFRKVLNQDNSLVGWCAEKYLQSSPLSKKQLEQIEQESKKLRFEVYAKEDISFAGTKRMVNRVELNEEIVPTDSDLKKAALQIWSDGNKKWDEFTIFFYLSDMNKEGSAFGIAEFNKSGLVSFKSGLGREIGSAVEKKPTNPLFPTKLDLDHNFAKPKPILTPPKVTELQYVKRELNGWTYTEVVSISVSKRQKIYYDIVKYQDDTGDDDGARTVIAKRYDIPLKASSAIAMEGALKKWPMPNISY